MAMTVKRYVVVHRSLWVIAGMALITSAGLFGMEPTVIPGGFAYVVVGLAGLLIRCPGCGCRVILQSESWRRILPIAKCPRCGADWTTAETEPSHRRPFSAPSPPFPRLERETIPHRHRGRKHAKRFSTRTLLFANFLCMPVLAVSLLAASPYSTYINRNAGFMLIAAVLVLSAASYFIRCRNCGESAWRHPNGWYGGWPPKRCYRCGQDFRMRGRV